MSHEINLLRNINKKWLLLEHLMMCSSCNYVKPFHISHIYSRLRSFSGNCANVTSNGMQRNLVSCSPTISKARWVSSHRAFTYSYHLPVYVTTPFPFPLYQFEHLLQTCVIVLYKIRNIRHYVCKYK